MSRTHVGADAHVGMENSGETPSDRSRDPERIFLGPRCIDDPCYGRTWTEDGSEPTCECLCEKPSRYGEDCGKCDRCLRIGAHGHVEYVRAAK